MLGIIYRDLKPENVLVRSDGHIMLSDFDLSLCSDAIPAVESPSCSPETATPSTPSYTRGAHMPFSCLPNRFFRSRKVQTLAPNRLFVAEPVDARSCSFVGTHEYVSPEVASGGSHGNAVDWWAFGIFIYEMIYGRTPFAAPSNETTLRNIIKKPLEFPTSPTPPSATELHARDLISGLLNKDPVTRLGSKRGAADVKKHPFFKSLNFALVRSLTPPEIPGLKTTRRRCGGGGGGGGSSSSNSNAQSTAFEYFWFETKGGIHATCRVGAARFCHWLLSKRRVYSSCLFLFIIFFNGPLCFRRTATWLLYVWEGIYLISRKYIKVKWYKI